MRVWVLCFAALLFNLSPVQATGAPEKNSRTSYLLGGILATVPGLGIGHAVQGRYLYKGLLFSIGEPVAAGVFLIGLGQSFASALGDGGGGSDGLAILGLAGYAGLRIWEILDAWIDGRSPGGPESSDTSLPSEAVQFAFLPLRPFGDGPGLSMVMRF